MDKKVALVLEGGGAKCAYQVGAIKALEELGYEFTAFSGASYGAFNIMLYLTGGLAKLEQYYNNITTKKIVIDPLMANFIDNFKGDQKDLVALASEKLKEIADIKEHRRVVTEAYHKQIRENIDPIKVLSHHKDINVTVIEVPNNSIILNAVATAMFSNPKLLPPLFATKSIIGLDIHDFTINNLIDYTIASASYPTYLPIFINNKFYLDGGIYNNIPYQYLLNKGYEDIIIIRTNIDKMPYPIEETEHIKIITPSRFLGSTINYRQDYIQNRIKLGYNDTMKLNK